MDRQILYPAQIPLVEDGLNAQRNAMVGIGHLAGAAFGSATVAASGFACEPGEGLSLVIAPGAILAPGVVDASAYSTLSAVSSALVRQFISRDPVTLAVPAAGATYIVYVSPQTADTDDTVLPFYNAADPSVTYAGQNNSGLTAPTVRRDEAVLGIAAAQPDGSHPLWLVTVPAGAAAITADMVSVASGAPFYPSLAAVAPRIVAPFNAQLAAAMGGYPLNAVVADTTTPGTFWVSTADANVSVPDATGATWQSLFNGYATQDWANGQFLQLVAKALQTVTGPVAFSGATTVPDITNFTGKNALNAETAEARYQPLLGFTPVQQGGGAGQGTNKIYLGWANDGSGLKCQIDATDEGYIAFRSEITPIGCPQFWPSTTPPAGWLLLNGSAFSVAQYPSLGALFPTGVLPDMRGKFFRGLDSGAGIDPDSGRAVLSVQQDALQNITGSARMIVADFQSDTTYPSGVFSVADAGNIPSSSNSGGGYHTLSFNASAVARTSTETRPINMAWNVIVRAG